MLAHQSGDEWVGPVVETSGRLRHSGARGGRDRGMVAQRERDRRAAESDCIGDLLHRDRVRSGHEETLRRRVAEVQSLELRIGEWTSQANQCTAIASVPFDPENASSGFSAANPHSALIWIVPKPTGL